MLKYLRMKCAILRRLLFSGRLSVAKIYNAAACYLSYITRRKHSGRLPIVTFFELSNRCNLHCVACRRSPTEIFDQNPNSESGFVPMGNMPVEMYQALIDEIKDRTMMAVLYVNGEPLLRPELGEMLRYASERGMATMISTNGMLLTEQRSEDILRSGVDFIKVAVSGFTQETYNRNHRGGDIQTVRKNLEDLVRVRDRTGSTTVIMLDYIIFRHNQHEAAPWQALCKELNVLFNKRNGISQGQPGVEELGSGVAEATGLCDWLWKMATVNWDGAIFPCCEYATWKGIKELGRYETGKMSLADTWNGQHYRKMRELHVTRGRKFFPRCEGCHYKGIRPQG
jgi:pyruvate-formate lyase-activating enzyme